MRIEKRLRFQLEAVCDSSRSCLLACATRYFRAAHEEGSAILRNSKQDLFSPSGRHDHFQQNLRRDTGKFAGSFSPFEISQFEGSPKKCSFFNRKIWSYHFWEGITTDPEKISRTGQFSEARSRCVLGLPRVLLVLSEISQRIFFDC